MGEKASVKDYLFLCCSGKRPPTKARKSPVGNWLSFFHLGKSNSVSKRKLKRHPSEPNEIKSIALPGQITAAVSQPEGKMFLYLYFFFFKASFFRTFCGRSYVLKFSFRADVSL